MSRSRLIQQLHKYAGAPAPQDDARERGIGVPATIAAGGALLAGNPMARLHETLDGFDFNKRRDELLTPHKTVMDTAHAAHNFTPTASTTEAEMKTFLGKLAPAEVTAYANAENNVARINSVAGQRWSSPLRFAAGAALAGYGAKKIYDNINHNSELRERQAGGNVKAASATPANPAIRSGLDYLKYVAPGALAGGAIGAMTGEDGDGRGWQGAALGAAAGLGVRQLAAARQFHNLSKEERVHRMEMRNYNPDKLPGRKREDESLTQYFDRANRTENFAEPHAVHYSKTDPELPNDFLGAYHLDTREHPQMTQVWTGVDPRNDATKRTGLTPEPFSVGDRVFAHDTAMTDELRNTLTSERNRRALIGGVGTTAALGAGAYTLGRKNKTESQSSENVKAASATPANPAIRSGLDYLKYVAPGALAGGAIGAMTGEDGDGRGWQGAALGAAAGLGVRQLAAARQFHNLSKEEHVLRTNARNFRTDKLPGRMHGGEGKTSYFDRVKKRENFADPHVVQYSKIGPELPEDFIVSYHLNTPEHPPMTQVFTDQVGTTGRVNKVTSISSEPLSAGDLVESRKVNMTDELRNTLTSERNRRALIGGVGTTAALGAGAYTLGRKNKTESQSGENVKAASFTSWVFPKSRFG